MVRCDATPSGGSTNDRRLVADPNVHAVIVCTPNNTHADLVIKVAAAGKGARIRFAPRTSSLTFVISIRSLSLRETSRHLSGERRKTSKLS